MALRQLAEGGTTAPALTRIAKETGLSGPALHRYFTSRDDLLNSLIRDGYDDAAAATARAADRSAKGSRGVRGRPHDLAAAHRAWRSPSPTAICWSRAPRCPAMRPRPTHGNGPARCWARSSRSSPPAVPDPPWRPRRTG
ncbi:helix-turn-helix domain-containing protein [Streptomyces sp. NPDC018055]|uniref:helix-turn-helix domain-containing protein n=1 Tax=Streptomyces sp. NPDC018055 TaxID=3365038 RepID=UPI00378FB99B